MMLSNLKFTLLLLLIAISFNSKAQLPDSILIKDHSWSFEYGNHFYNYVFVNTGKNFQIYQTYSKHLNGIGQTEQSSESFARKKVGHASKDQVIALTNTLGDTNFSKFKIQDFGYDMNWINAHCDELIKKLEYNDGSWSALQYNYVKEQLSIEENYNEALRTEIGREGIYTISKHSSANFSVIIYYPNRASIVTEASENHFGLPWNVNGTLSYNPKIAEVVLPILPKNESFAKNKFKPYPTLIYELAEAIFRYNCRKKLYELAPLTYEKELSELKDSFEILKMEELGYRGRYIWNVDHVYKIGLKNKQMHENVFLQYLITKQGNTLYSRDSLLHEAHYIVDRVQSVGFLMDFLNENQNRKIDIYYTDNNSMNDYTVDGFNKNPVEWAKFEKYETDSTYISTYCGCNFRFENDYLMNNGIFFELIDEFGNHSIWILLPNGTPVIYHFEGNQVYKFNNEQLGTKGISVQKACRKLDEKGNLISK